MSRLKIGMLILVTSVSGLAVFAWSMRVPTKTFEDKEWFQTEETALKRADRNELINRMIDRARLECFINPAIPHKRVIFFDRAWFAPPKDVYLMFGVVGRADVAVVYRGELRRGRLLWKASNSRSP